MPSRMMTTNPPGTDARPRRRTVIVWVSFIASMTLVGSILLLTDPTPPPTIALHPTGLWDTAASGHLDDTIFDTRIPIQEGRFQEIVVHDSGRPRGTVEDLARDAQSAGLDGIGYHFVIGNGNGLGNGEIHIGDRWDRQIPGVHVTGPNAEWHNSNSIGICLIGNGDTRPFTKRQIRELVRLVVNLQERLNLPIDKVRLHRDLSDVPSPGQFFPTAEFREELSLSGRG